MRTHPGRHVTISAVPGPAHASLHGPGGQCEVGGGHGGGGGQSRAALPVTGSVERLRVDEGAGQVSQKSMCVFVYVFGCVYVSECACVCVFECVYVSECVCMCVFACVSVSE